MQFRDLKTQYTVLKDEMDKAILDVVASSAFVMGPKIKEMETAFADYVGAKHCVACNSGTDALLLALKVWDVKAGDAVFVPSFTFFASVPSQIIYSTFLSKNGGIAKTGRILAHRGQFVNLLRPF